MIERRAIACPSCGPTIGERLGAHLVRCTSTRWTRVRADAPLELVGRGSCGVVVATCSGCGGMTLELHGAAAACAVCGFERAARPEELEAVARGAAPARVQVAASAPAPPAKSAPRAPAPVFVAPPMPVFRRGAALPAPQKPRGYQPPKER